MTTRVLIVDDHPMVAEGIQAILESYDEIDVVCTLGNGQEAVDRVNELAPDVILLDLNMPGLSGLNATEMILERLPETRIVILSGAKGSLQPTISDGRETLTSREQTILLELAQGQSNKDVANTLNISVRTVETHRKNIKRKLGISSTAGLTRYALEHGVLQGTGI